MALNKTTLKNELKAALQSAKNLTDVEQQQEKIADELAKAIDRFVRSAAIEGVRVKLPGELGKATQDNTVNPT